MKKAVILSFLLSFSLWGFSQDKAYVIYNSKGKKVSYKKMIKQLNLADVVMFGELHNNPIAHWMQLEVTHSLAKKNNLILGAEMLEADNQDELDAYMQDSLDQKGLDTAARLWPNYKTDYAPLVNYAKENNIQFVASNIPRRYANMVYRNGFEILDSLSAEEKSWMAPLPMKFDSELPTYQRILEMMGDHGSPTLVMAQATKDATMAYFILKNYKPDHLFIHYNGAYHSDYHEGIVWYMNQERTDLHYKTITTVSQASIKKLLEENKGKADFIICVDGDMTTTY